MGQTSRCEHLLVLTTEVVLQNQAATVVHHHFNPLLSDTETG